MHRINLMAVLAMFMCLLPIRALAQDVSLPGPGEIRELRSDDARCPTGHRCFVVGSYVRGANLSPDALLDRVNRDVEDASEHVSMAQLEAANPCLVLYVRGQGGSRSYAKNGSCESYNHSRERVAYNEFCSGASHCGRWLIASSARYQTVYRVPAERHLTPSERADEMVQTLDNTNVSEGGTVPAPSQMGSWLTEFHGLMGEEQPPTYEEARNVIGAIGRALTRTSGIPSETSVGDSAQTSPVTRVMDDTDTSGQEASDTSLTADASGQHDSSSAVQASPGPNPYLMFLLGAIGSAGACLLIFFLILRRRDSRTAQRESDLNEDVQLAINQRDDQAKLNRAVRDEWERYSGGSLSLSSDRLRNALELAKNYLALGAIWNGRGELSETSFKEVCDKADRFDAVEREWKRLMPNHIPFEASNLDALQESGELKAEKQFEAKLEVERKAFEQKLKDQKNVEELEKTLRASYTQEIEQERERHEKVEIEQRETIETLQSDVKNANGRITALEATLSEARASYDRLMERVTSELAEFIGTARQIFERAEDYIEEPAPSVFPFVEGLHALAGDLVQPMEELFVSLTGGQVPGLVPAVAGADLDGTRLSAPNPELLEKLKEISSQAQDELLTRFGEEESEEGTIPGHQAPDQGGNGADSDEELAPDQKPLERPTTQTYIDRAEIEARVQGGGNGAAQEERFESAQTGVYHLEDLEPEQVGRGPISSKTKTLPAPGHVSSEAAGDDEV